MGDQLILYFWDISFTMIYHNIVQDSEKALPFIVKMKASS